MLARLLGEGRRLYDRRPTAARLIVDADGVSLGPRYPLVERHRGGYRALGVDAAGVMLRAIFDYDDDPAPFVSLCRSMAKALNDDDLLRAQLLGLQMPVGVLKSHHLGRLARLAVIQKAGYNSNQPRNAAGEWGFSSNAAATTAPMVGTAFATAGTAASWDLLADGASAAAETVGAGTLAAPVLLVGGLLVPWSNSDVHAGDVIGHPDMAYRYDEGMRTLMHVDPDGGRTILFHGSPSDGEYRDESGHLIGRTLPQGLDLAPEFLNAMSAPSDQTRSKTDAEAPTDDRPQICPDPSFAAESMSARSSAYQMQITGLPEGLVVRYNGVKFDGCNQVNGHLQETKADAFEKFMVDSTNWQDWFRGREGIEDQTIRQSKAAPVRHIDWYFAEEPVADYFRARAVELKLTNISVYYVPAVLQ